MLLLTLQASNPQFTTSALLAHVTTAIDAVAMSPSLGNVCLLPVVLPMLNLQLLPTLIAPLDATPAVLGDDDITPGALLLAHHTFLRLARGLPMSAPTLLRYAQLGLSALLDRMGERSLTDNASRFLHLHSTASLHSKCFFARGGLNGLHQ